MKGTPGDVLGRVEALEDALTVRPVDVLREVQSLRDELKNAGALDE